MSWQYLFFWVYKLSLATKFFCRKNIKNFSALSLAPQSILILVLLGRQSRSLSPSSFIKLLAVTNTTCLVLCKLCMDMHSETRCCARYSSTPIVPMLCNRAPFTTSFNHNYRLCCTGIWKNAGNMLLNYKEGMNTPLHQTICQNVRISCDEYEECLSFCKCW